MAQGYGVGASLASMGLDQKRESIEGIRRAAAEEDRRALENKRLETQEKAGKQQLTSTVGATAGFALGAQYGSAGGPWGALIGGALGAIAGGLI